MTKERREELDFIMKQLNLLHERLEQIQKDEQEYYDNYEDLPDAEEGFDNYYISEESLEILDKVIDCVFDAAAIIHDDMPKI